MPIKPPLPILLFLPITLTILISLHPHPTTAAPPNPNPKPNWPLADIRQPLDLHICHSRGTCVTLETAKTPNTPGYPPNCYSLFNTDKLSISPGTGLRCTLYFDGSCRSGPKSKDANRQRSGQFGGVVENFAYPGRGDFEGDEWWYSGFYSSEARGKPPKSLMCWNVGEKQTGL